MWTTLGTDAFSHAIHKRVMVIIKLKGGYAHSNMHMFHF